MAKLASDLAGALQGKFSGELLTAADAGYEEARRIHNGMIDKRPALIARCRTAQDVAAGVNLARTEGLEVSVRGGGHNVAGKAVTDGGVMIDLSPMKDVSVDDGRHTARAGGGVTWGEYNEATAQHGVATTGGVVSTTGIAGLTLGGGVGWLMGTHGLAIDNLRSAEVVLASGEVVEATEESDPDLFWAIRGGGGNFGVATSLTYQTHPLTTVLGGVAAHALPAAPEMFGFFRDFTKELPDELTVFGVMVHAPDGSGMKICGMPICHCGTDEAAAAESVRPLREFGPPAIDLIDRMPYPVVNTLIDANFPRGTLNYWKSAFLTELSDAAVAKMIEAFENSPTAMCAIVVEHFHGAATRVDPTATAFPHREPGYNLIILSQWTDPADNDKGIAWARETFDALRPHTSDRAYVNYLAADESDRVRAAYGPNYDRLVEVKRKYDPDNLFRLNQNIDPKG